jgi:Rrf2 family protein
MKVSALEEYGLRCMLQLARRQRESGETPVTLAELARHEGLTIAYVAKMIRRLRRAGLVQSVLGRTGGYTLTQPAAEVSVGEILDALGGKLYDTDYCSRYSGDQATCTHMGNCSIRSLWGVIGTLLDKVLGDTMLADLIGSEQQICAVLDGRTGSLWPAARG